MTRAIPISTSDLPFFFDESHKKVACKVYGAATTLMSEETTVHDQSYMEQIGRRLGAELDLYGFAVPDGSLDLRALCIVREALGFVSPLADGIFAVQGLAGYSLIHAGGDAHAERLAAMRRGDEIGGFALTEPGAGSDTSAISTTAELHGDDYVINGEKTFISNVGIASFYVVFARTEDRLSAFVVPAETKGLEWELIPMSVSHPVGKLRFTNMRVPKSALLGEYGKGVRIAMTTLGAFRASVGAAAVGMARRAFEEATDHVIRREQFGKPLAEQQLVQGYLAEMATEIDAARLLVYRAAHAKDTTDSRASREVGIAKMFATESAWKIIDKAVQLFGGLGVTKDHIVEQLYRDIRPLRIYEGTTEIQKLIISRSVIDEAKKRQ